MIFFKRVVFSHPLQVFLAKGNVPADSYRVFMDILLETIRGEIGACVEKAYTKISLQEGARLLFIQSLPEVKTFAKEVCFHNSALIFYI